MKKPTLNIALEGGRAAEHTVSFRDLSVMLTAIQEMLISVARSITNHQIPRKSLESVCALEAVGGFKGGSFSVTAQLENYSETPGGTIGLQAAQELLLGVKSLAKKDPRVPPDFDYEVFQNLQGAVSLLERGYRAIGLSLNGTTRPLSAKVNSAVKRAISGLQMPIVRVHETEVIGTLVSISGQPSSDVFSGEIIDVAKNIWKARFDSASADTVRALWQRKVRARGLASFYEIRRPTLKVTQIEGVEDGDFSNALNEMVGAGKSIYGGLNLQDYIRELRERQAG